MYKRQHQNIQVTQQILDDWIKQYQNLNYYNWAIIIKDYDHLPVGNISVVEVNEKTHLAVIGYCPVSYTHLDVYKRQSRYFSFGD